MIKKKVIDKNENKIKFIPQKFNPKKYLNYFINECQKREEERTRASTTIDGQINAILNKKTKFEKEEDNFYSIEYKIK